MDEDNREEEQRINPETKILLGIFPAELWTKVFDAVGDSDDLLACSRASLLWNGVLEPKRAEYLFPEVIRILCEQKHLTSNDSPEILSLRLVCKVWKLGVNRLLQSRLPIEKLQFDKFHHDIASDLAYKTYFRIYKPKIVDTLWPQITPMLRAPRFRLEENNPFPSRHLEVVERRLTNALALDWHDRAAFDVYRANTQYFLEAAGHHFWYAQIDSGLNMPPNEWYYLLLRYVVNMPNLKFLYIKCPWLCSYEINMLSRIPAFPVLKHLQLLCLDNAPISVMNAVFTANRHVKALIVIPKLRLPTQEEQRESFNYPLIQDPHTFSTCFTSQREFDSIPRDWKLQVLRLGLKSCIDLHWPCIFSRLEYFRDSLIELFLQLPKASTPDQRLIFWEFSRTMLKLPKLKRLDIEIANYCSIDFLLGLWSLEYVRFHFVHHEVLPPHRGTEAQVINVNAVGFARFMECNIWDLIPSLKKVDIQLNNGLTNTYIRGQV